MSLRVVNLGLPKSGTTSFARALKLAGLRVADFRIRPRQTDDTDLHRAYVGDLMYRSYFATGDPGAPFAGFDAISEMSVLRKRLSLWPQTDFGIISALWTHHPGLRFVATRRGAAAISASMMNWSDLGSARLPMGAVPGLPSGYGGDDATRIRWIEAHYAHLRCIFAGRSDFLEIDVSDPSAHTRLSEFLQMDLPWWGRANRGPSHAGTE